MEDQANTSDPNGPLRPVRYEIGRALMSMMARSMTGSKSKAGYIDARPHIPQLEQVLLQRTAGPYIGSQALTPKLRPVRFAPQSGHAPGHF
jgi:hypothetical protein